MVEGFKRTLAWLTGAPSTPAPPQATKPAVQTTDAQGASPATGPNAQPAPQTQPASTPQTTTQRTDPPVDANGFVPYNPKSQHIGGFFAGLAIGPVPLGSLIANLLIERGILPPSTPEFRQSLAEGQMAGGLIGLLWGAGQTPSTTPIQAPRPIAAAPTGASGGAPPLTVTPNLTGVLVGAGGVVTIAVAAAQMAAVMSDGPVGGGDIKERDERQVHHPISRKVHRALEEHPNLRGKYRARDPRFELRAVSKEAHNGYQEWHREIDDEVVRWIEGRREATVETFEEYLRSVYSRPEVAARFQGGL